MAWAWYICSNRLRCQFLNAIIKWTKIFWTHGIYPVVPKFIWHMFMVCPSIKILYSAKTLSLCPHNITPFKKKKILQLREWIWKSNTFNRSCSLFARQMLYFKPLDYLNFTCGRDKQTNGHRALLTILRHMTQPMFKMSMHETQLINLHPST